MRKLAAVAVGVGMLAGTMVGTAEATPRLHGDPVAAAAWALDQPAKGLCGPTSAAIVAGMLTGRAVGASESRWAARDLGLMDYELGGGVTGMLRASLPRLLAEFGVAAREERTSLNGLRIALDAGRGIILHVDSDELWFGSDVGAEDGGADHFMVLVAIDDARDAAIVHDPGRSPAYGFAEGAGHGQTVSLSRLADAWEDSGGAAVVTDAPASITA